MTLDKSNIGDKVVVKKFLNDDMLKTRVYSFGMIEGSTLEIVNISLAKQTIQVKSDDGTLIGLRLTEAKNIEVSK
ncbi:FeoA family protein [Arcobacter sp. FWKO B]|uniref:FeoA family protein n=1 Tax=Arcobacter sp. FWKO B TaxID=2593672 RepID=UPI0018A433BE|nr:FeoA family protein [Arcobacter sp. FWKO B]QOG12561.1 ferrous iron transport protein A [Arcobacter sp. FWKO B]